jgi:plastocyanin
MHVDACTTLFIYVHGSILTNKMTIKTNIMILMISVFLASVLVIGVGDLSEVYAQTDSLSNNDSTGTASQTNMTNTSSDSIPTAQSVYDTGVMSLPSSVKGVIIFIPDEAHHPASDDKTISPKSPNYLPTTLKVPEGTEVAFIHDDPSHIHIGIIKDKDGNAAWTTTPVEYPDGSDTKSLSSAGSPYSISDKQYSPPMEGKIVVTPEKSTGTLTVGGFLCPTDQLSDCKSQFSKAGFEILSEHNFVTKSVQKDIAGDNTMLIYSTAVPIKDALNSLGQIIKSLPYK